MIHPGKIHISLVASLWNFASSFAWNGFASGATRGGAFAAASTAFHALFRRRVRSQSLTREF